jgi:hypothetical protein
MICLNSGWDSLRKKLRMNEMKRFLVFLCASLLFWGVLIFSLDFDLTHDTVISPLQSHSKDISTITLPSEKWTIPEPAQMFFLGSGLIGVGVFVRRRFKK